MLKNGDIIMITGLPRFCGAPNAYLGCTGKVTDLDKNGFVLDMGHASLIINDLYKFEYVYLSSDAIRYAKEYIK